MHTLFDIGPVYPEGFSYHPQFLTEAEESKLLEAIAGIDLEPMKFHEYEAKRKVAGFGQGWSFTEQRLKPGKAIPAAFDFLIEKITSRFSIEKEAVAQFLITEYPAGAVINWHRDAPPFDVIIGVSLLSDCTFKLRPQDKEKQTRAATISFTVQRRALYIMQGPAKTEWQHSTAPVKKERYSLTFRTLKK
jgi:alkylated DNA repair dioxygenase AlkB